MIPLKVEDPWRVGDLSVGNNAVSIDVGGAKTSLVRAALRWRYARECAVEERMPHATAMLPSGASVRSERWLLASEFLSMHARAVWVGGAYASDQHIDSRKLGAPWLNKSY